MAIHVFLAVLEYYLFAALVGIFLPFGLLAPTKFLAEKAIGAVVAAVGQAHGAEPSSLRSIEPVLSSIHFAGPEITLNELWSMFLTVCALMLLCWKAPHLASSLLARLPNLGAGDARAGGLCADRGGLAAARAASCDEAARRGDSSGRAPAQRRGDALAAPAVRRATRPVAPARRRLAVSRGGGAGAARPARVRRRDVPRRAVGASRSRSSCSSMAAQTRRCPRPAPRRSPALA